MPAGEVAAQQVLTKMGPQCVLPVPAPGQGSDRARSFSHQFDVAALLAQPRTATFDVSYEGFSPEAREAFAYAVAIWERHVASAVPIRIDAVWDDLGEGLLGSAGPRLLSYAGSAPSGIEPNTWYPYALADAILGEDVEDAPGDFDVSATFNSDFDRWHFDTSTPAPSNRFDFATVVLHELGHGLGFIGTGSESEGCGDVGQQGQSGLFPYAFDLFVVDGAGVSILNASRYPNPSALLGEVLTSDALFFDGPATADAFGAPAPLYAPSDFLSGSSYSHLDEDVFVRGDEQALMTPFLNNGERVESPGSVTCGIFADMGWPLGPGCAEAALAREADASPETRRARRQLARAHAHSTHAHSRGGDECQPIDVEDLEAVVYPNPAVRSGCVSLRSNPSGRVTVSVYDALGREVVRETQFVSAREAGGVRECIFQLPSPTPGLYVVQIEGEDFEEVRKWTVLR